MGWRRVCWGGYNRVGGTDFIGDWFYHYIAAMKWRLLLAFILMGGVVVAQGGDGSFFCRAHWKKGEKKFYTIVHRGLSELTYQAAITVLDSNANGFTLQWVLTLPDSLLKRRPHLVDSMPVYGGVTIIYHTDVTGVFTGLRNWEEVRMAYIEMMEIRRPKNMSDAERDLFNRVEAQYRTREAVEAGLIKEIRLFHSVYGHLYTNPPKKVKSQLPNVWGSDQLLPAVTSYLLAALGDRAVVSIKEETDSAGMQQMVESFLQRSGGKDSALAAMKRDIARFSILHATLYDLRPSSGWLVSMEHQTRMTSVDRNEQEEYDLFESPK